MTIRHVKIIMGKELRGYFNSPLAYIFMTVFLVLSSWLYFRSFFLIGQSSMRDFFAILPWFFLVLIPAMTMRLWAEEKKLGTFETLLTAPITEWEAVLGKFMASFTFLFITLVCSSALPMILFFIGNPDWGAILGGYLGSLFLGAVYLSLGLWISSNTDNQIIAFIISVLVMFLLYVMGESFVLHTAPQKLVPFFKYVAVGQHFKSIGRGVIDSRDIIYYFLTTYLFLYLNVVTLKSRKWH